MKKFKIVIIVFLIFVCIVNIPIYVFADNELEEEFDFAQLDEFLKDVDSEIDKTPNINSRHAIIYDRTTRENTIWKKGKRKMQNGINY